MKSKAIQLDTKGNNLMPIKRKRKLGYKGKKKMIGKKITPELSNSIDEQGDFSKARSVCSNISGLTKEQVGLFSFLFIFIFDWTMFFYNQFYYFVLGSGTDDISLAISFEGIKIKPKYGPKVIYIIFLIHLWKKNCSRE